MYRKSESIHRRKKEHVHRIERKNDIGTMQVRRYWCNTAELLGVGGGPCQPRMLYLVKISFKNKERMKPFSERQKSEIIHQQWICIRRNVKGIPSSRKNMISLTGKVKSVKGIKEPLKWMVCVCICIYEWITHIYMVYMHIYICRLSRWC